MRPMNEEEVSYWPKDERLQLVSGVDFVGDSEEALKGKFSSGIVDVESVTQVYYLGMMVRDPYLSVYLSTGCVNLEKIHGKKNNRRRVVC